MSASTRVIFEKVLVAEECHIAHARRPQSSRFFLPRKLVSLISSSLGNHSARDSIAGIS
jgi:hypothetical protein